jgi:hypothetical protein
VIDAASRALGRAGGSRGVWIALAIAAAVRLAILLRGSGVSGDESLVGLNGLASFHGEFPVYFAGQSFMGTAADVYLAGVAYALLGIAPSTLELVSLLLSIAWVGLVVRLTWEVWGDRAAGFAALWFAVPPDFALWWAQEARLPYHLALVLGALALLLARRIPGAAAPTAARRLGVLGLVLGLGFWTNFLTLIYAPAVVLRLALGRYRPRTVGEIVFPALGFVLGALPHLMYTLRRGSAVPPLDVGVGVEGLLAHLSSLAQAWPVLLGAPPGFGPIPILLTSLLTTVYVGLALVAARASRVAPRQQGADLAALGCVVVVTLGALVASRYGDLLWPRVFYLTPIWTALPPIAAAGLAALPGRGIGFLLGLLLITVHGVGIARGLLRGEPPVPASILLELAPAAEQRRVAEALAHDGITRLYQLGLERRDLTFVSAERVIVSNYYVEAISRHARAVDSAPPAAVGWWVREPGVPLERSLGALGSRFEYRPYPPLGGVYAKFAAAPVPLRELDPDTLRVTASVNGTRGAWTLDRDAWTAWRTAGSMRGGEWVEVDLGEVRPVAMVRWLPRVYEEAPIGLTLETSIDRADWRRLVEVPSYVGPLYWSAGRPMGRVRSGRVELRVAPTLARHVRITQTGQAARWPWTISELFVYVEEPSAPLQPAPWRSGQELAREVRRAGVQKLYADHGWGAAVALADPEIRVMPANLDLDGSGWVGPRANLTAPVDWKPGAGVLLEPVDAEGVGRVAQTLGRPVAREAIGELVLLRPLAATRLPGRPLATGDLVLTASLHADRAPLAADGDRSTRWATGQPQAPGDWVRVDLRAAGPVRAVQVWSSHAHDWPRGVSLEGSPDGAVWQRLATQLSTEGSLRWGGIALLRDGVESVRLDFPPTVLRALRLTLTRGDPVYDWSVHELTVYAD